MVKPLNTDALETFLAMGLAAISTISDVIATAATQDNRRTTK